MNDNPQRFMWIFEGGNLGPRPPIPTTGWRNEMRVHWWGINFEFFKPPTVRQAKLLALVSNVNIENIKLKHFSIILLWKQTTKWIYRHNLAHSLWHSLPWQLPITDRERVSVMFVNLVFFHVHFFRVYSLCVYEAAAGSPLWTVLHSWMMPTKVWKLLS